MPEDAGTVSLSTQCSKIAQKIELLRRLPDDSWFTCAAASGSYWIHDNKWHLITNWHNLTGCHPETHTALSPKGTFPTQVRLRFLRNGEFEGRKVFHWSFHELDLYSAEGMPLWLEHPSLGHRVDVVALPTFNYDPSDETVATVAINRHGHWFNLNVVPGDECFVLGYPGGFSGGFDLPLWKRASIASEPSLDLDGLPKLLVDTATRSGMSGAPVVAISNGWHVPIGGKIQDGVWGRVEKFVGIYSSRIDDDKELSIGTVWKERVIEEILLGEKPGQNPLHPS